MTLIILRLSLKKEEIDKYNITFSNWFENRSDYLDFLDNFGIYISQDLLKVMEHHLLTL